MNLPPPYPYPYGPPPGMHPGYSRGPPSTLPPDPYAEGYSMPPYPYQPPPYGEGLRPPAGGSQVLHKRPSMDMQEEDPRKRQKTVAPSSPIPNQRLDVPKKALEVLGATKERVKDAMSRVLSEMYIPGISAPSEAEHALDTGGSKRLEKASYMDYKSPDAMFWHLFKEWKPASSAPTGKDAKTLAKIFMQEFTQLKQSFEMATQGKMPPDMLSGVCGIPILCNCEDLRRKLATFRNQGVSLAAIGRAIEIHYASLQKFTRTRGALGGFRQRACLELWKFFEIKRRWENGDSKCAALSASLSRADGRSTETSWQKEAEVAWDRETNWLEQKYLDGAKVMQDKHGNYYPRFSQVWGSESAFSSAQKVLVPNGTVPILTPGGYRVVPESQAVQYSRRPVSDEQLTTDGSESK